MRLRKYKATASIPTASMADIAFLLIIFFMLTAVFTSTRGLEFAFPKDDPNQLDVQPEESIHIRIVSPGQYVVDKRPMDLEQTASYIESKMEEVPDKPVIIHTGSEVPYYAMVEVFDLLTELEVANIAIPTQSEIERWKALGVFVE